MRRTVGVAVVSVLSLTLIACGDDGPATAEPETSTSHGTMQSSIGVVFRYEGDVSHEDLADLRSILMARLEAFELDDSQIDTSQRGVVRVAIRPARSVGPDRVFSAVGAGGLLRFRPVLGSSPGSGALTPSEGDIADQSVTLPSTAPDGTVTTYQLGPAVRIDDPVEAASAKEVGPTNVWAVALIVKRMDEFNDTAAQCYARDRSCPSGQLAIVIDSRVIAAPTVSQPSYQRDQVQVTGNLSEEAARDLALVLSTGPLPVRLERVDGPQSGG